MDQNAIRVELIEGVSADVRPTVDDKHALARHRHSLCKRRTGKSGPHNNPIELHMIHTMQKELSGL